LKYQVEDRINVICKIKLEGSRSIWTIEIENNSESEIVSVTYPVLNGIRAGKNYEDDILIFPHDWRQVIVNPVREIRQETEKSLFMNWIDLYDEKGGIYLGVHTKKGDVRDFKFLTSSYDISSLKEGVTEYNISIPSGKKWSSSDYVIALHEGDWHKGADIYREWAEKTIDKPEIPEWAFWCDGWRGSNVNALRIDGFSLLSQAARYNLTYGINFQGNNRYMLDGPLEYVGVAFPYPSPIWGPIKEFKQNLQDVKILGDHTNFYINAIRFSPGRFLGAKGPLKRLCYIVPRAWIEEDIYIPEFYKKPSSKVDPINWARELVFDTTSKIWQDYLCYWAKKYVKDYGATGIYFDQLENLYPPKEDMKWLEKLHKELTKINPHYVLTGEGANVYMGKYVIHMTSGVFNHTEIYRYTLPHQIILDGGWNGGASSFFGGDKRWNCVFLTGCRYEGIGRIAEPTLDKIWQQRLWLRRKTKQLLYPSIFKDTVGITIYDKNGKSIPNPEIVKMGKVTAYDGVQAKWFLKKDSISRLALVNLINSPAQEGYTVKIKTDEFGPVKSAWCWTLNEEFFPVEGKEENGEFSFSVPMRENATIALVNKSEPIVEIQLPRPYTSPGTTVEVKVKFLNLNSSPMNLTTTWELPEGWQGKGLRVFNLEPGKYVEKNTWIKIPENASLQRYDFHMVVHWKGKSLKKYLYLTVINPIFMNLQKNSEGIEVTLENVGKRKYTASLSISLPEPLTTDRENKKIEISPGEVKTVIYPLFKVTEMKKPLIAKVTLKYGKEKEEKIISIYPPIPNPDFELDSAGDNRPDWWTAFGRGGKGLTYMMPAINVKLDKSVKYSGNSSLRLNPLGVYKKYFKTEFAFPLIRGYLPSGKKYMFSIAVRKISPDTDVFVQVNGRQLIPKKVGEWEILKTIVERENIKINLYNGSDKPVWFDSIKIKELTK